MNNNFTKPGVHCCLVKIHRTRAPATTCSSVVCRCPRPRRNGCDADAMRLGAAVPLFYAVISLDAFRAARAACTCPVRHMPRTDVDWRRADSGDTVFVPCGDPGSASKTPLDITIYVTYTVASLSPFFYEAVSVKLSTYLYQYHPQIIILAWVCHAIKY